MPAAHAGPRFGLGRSEASGAPRVQDLFGAAVDVGEHVLAAADQFGPGPDAVADGDGTALDEPFGQAAVKHADIAVPHGPEGPPDPRGARRADRIVDDDPIISRDPHCGHGEGEGSRVGQHVGQVDRFVGDGVDVEEARTLNAAFEELRGGISSGGSGGDGCRRAPRPCRGSRRAIRLRRGRSRPVPLLEVHVDAPVVPALLLDLADSHPSDLPGVRDMRPAAGLKVDVPAYPEHAHPSGPARRCDRHGPYEVRVRVEFGLVDPKRLDREGCPRIRALTASPTASLSSVASGRSKSSRLLDSPIDPPVTPPCDNRGEPMQAGVHPHVPIAGGPNRCVR